MKMAFDRYKYPVGFYLWGAVITWTLTIITNDPLPVVLCYVIATATATAAQISRFKPSALGLEDH